MITQTLSAILLQIMQKETKHMTICFLLKRSDDGRIKTCLGEKKRGYRVGKLNGPGGKIEEGETPKDCVIRETSEEFGICLNSIREAGEIIYEGIDKIHHCYIFVSNEWQGNPTETEEMKPDWFDVENIPFERMGKTDPLWLTEVLNGKSVEAKFRFDKVGNLSSRKLRIK